jgi:hypothetical protein
LGGDCAEKRERFGRAKNLENGVREKKLREVRVFFLLRSKNLFHEISERGRERKQSSFDFANEKKTWNYYIMMRGRGSERRGVVALSLSLSLSLSRYLSIK